MQYEQLMWEDEWAMHQLEQLKHVLERQDTDN
jgi:hypothetical protein